MTSTTTHSWQRDMLLIFVAVAVFFCIGLGARAYLTPSEARYIEIPRQMLATGDWLTPHLNGVPYFEKPPLFYWMQAGIMSLLGLGEFAGRLATVLIVSCTCMYTYATARIIYSRLAGLLAAGALATCAMGYILGHAAMLDAPVTLFITATIYSFIAGTKTGKARFYYAMYIAAALAMMSKGLIGIVLPGLVIGGWIALTKNWQLLKKVRLFSGTLLFLAIAAPWHIYMAKTHPEFLNFYFINEHFNRYISDEHKRTAPWWFFIAVTFAGSMPWSFFIPGSVRGRLRGNQDKLFLLLWILLPLIFFSASHSKLLSYIFPIFPPLFVLIGQNLAESWNATAAPRRLQYNALFVAGFFILTLLGYAICLAHPAILGAKLVAKFAELPIIQPLLLLPFALSLCALLAAAVIKARPRYLIITLGAVGAIFALTANFAGANIDNASLKPLITELKPQLKDDDMVVAYNSYWQDLPVYLNRNVTVAGWEGELSFGIENYPATHAWMIDADSFWQRCKAAKTGVYVFMRSSEFENLTPHTGCHLAQLGANGNSVLLQKD